MKPLFTQELLEKIQEEQRELWIAFWEANSNKEGK
jgi:hypothetical protein